MSAFTRAIVVTDSICTVVLTTSHIFLTFIDICRQHTESDNRHTHACIVTMHVHTYVTVIPCPATGTFAGVWCRACVIAVTIVWILAKSYI